MVTMLNQQLSTQMFAAMQEKEDQVSPIQPNKVLDYANPIEAEVIKVHETSGLNNAPIAFVTTMCFTSLIGAVALYLVGNKRLFASKGKKLLFNTFQSIMPFVYAIIAGYVVTWYSTWIFGFELENFNRVALYLAIVVAAFIYMIFATLRWLKLLSIVIYILLMFFSMAAIQLSPEMMPAFYRDYIVFWLPLRIYADGLKEVLFYGKNFINQYSMVFIWIIAVSFVLVWIKNLVEKVKA